MFIFPEVRRALLSELYLSSFSLPPRADFSPPGISRVAPLGEFSVPLSPPPVTFLQPHPFFSPRPFLFSTVFSDETFSQFPGCPPARNRIVFFHLPTPLFSGALRSSSRAVESSFPQRLAVRQGGYPVFTFLSQTRDFFFFAFVVKLAFF